jgi:hypothetical protein
MHDEIDDVLEEILVDAYGDDEQLTAFEVAFQQSARFPFPARIVGTTVEVLKIDYDGDERGGLSAVCRREGETYRVSVADLRPGPSTVETTRLLAAYRRWCGLPPLKPNPARLTPHPWEYQPVAARQVRLARPLALKLIGPWDPADQYWGEEDEELDPIMAEVIAAGPRQEYEMEQVIPGVDDDDFDVDPVADAAELHRGGHDRIATGILQDLIAADERCIDAWVHLGNIAFDAKGPKAAIEFYDTAVAMAEVSLPEGFNGVLPWGLIDNRPFLRALHGLGLCAWRQRRWDDAVVRFTNRLWLEGSGTIDALWCLHQVTARRRWRSG